MKKKKLFNYDAIASKLGISISNGDCPGVEELFEAVVVFPDLTLDEILRYYSGLSESKFKKAMSWLEQKKIVSKGKLNAKICKLLCNMQEELYA